MRSWSWTWWLRLMVAAAAISRLWQAVDSDPQTKELGTVGCSNKPVKNVSDFIHNLNATFSDLRTQLSEDNRFATAQSQYVISSEPVYGMVQCRNYMSQTDCLACYAAAVSVIRNCSDTNATGARAVFDGCFLRYEDYDFFKKTSDNWPICEEGTASTVINFTEEGTRLLSDLGVATPRTKAYFAASKRSVGDSRNSTVYGVAQCAQTVSQGDCQGCLTAAYENLQTCLPNRNGRLVDSACFMRYSDAPFFPDNQTTDILPFLQLPTGSSVNEKAVIGGAIGGAGLVAIVVTIFISRRLRKALTGNILGATELQRPNRYSYKDLKEATDNFSEENKLGQGGFGAVYKATLRNETVVAVKKLNINHGRAKADFESEVRLISNVHHRNLVRLLGCCSEGSELLLVYEYMQNKSLDRFLYGENRGMLSWKQRTDVIFGTARGLAYLHELYHETIIHRDIKPGNILLDNQFQAKIADFGLVKLLPQNQTHLSTGVIGTFGYTAPEYAMHGHLSEKVDIYSFGIVILEIISGRRCRDMHPDSTAEYLLSEARKLYERGMHENLADAKLNSSEDYDVEELKKMVEIAMLCVKSTPSSRPTMSQLISMISSDGSMGQHRPSFNYENEIALVSAASHATVSITQFTGR